MAGIPTTNIPSPNVISLPAANYELISDLQLLAPHYWKEFVNKFGMQNFTTWLSTFGGMEKVEGREFFHFEDTGKLMAAVTNKTAVVGPAAGATVTVTIAVNDHWDAGTKSPIRVGETVRLASNGVEGKVLTVNKTVDNAHTMTVRPLKSTQAFVSAGSLNLLANEIIKLGSNTEAGEASTNIDPQMPIDERITNTTTEIRDDWNATDRAEMEQIFYEYENDGGFGSAGIARGKQGAYTYRGLVLANRRFLNNIDFKLLFGGIQNNTGLNAGTVGTKGLVPEIVARGNAVTYSLGNLGISKLHAITAQMDVNGNAQQAIWLMDIFQRQEFDDTLFAQYPAGAYVWGSGAASEAASVAYGFDSFKIDNYMLQLKKYAGFNTEVTHGKTPDVDQYRNFGIIMPQGEVTAKYGNGGGAAVRGRLKNIQVMYQEPMGGGTIANGVKVWEYGGAAPNNLTATMQHTVSMIKYPGIRAAGLQQFFTISGS
jgi:hypothetical protein